MLSATFWRGTSPEYFGDAPAVNGAYPELCYFRTSGSSAAGVDRWVGHSREGLLASAEAVGKHLNLSSKDRWYLALPIHHVGGVGVLARAYVHGSAVTKHHGKWDAHTAALAMQQQAVTHVSFVPTQLVDLISKNISCPATMRAVIIGGGALDQDVEKRARELDWPVLRSYGMTETASQIATGSCDQSDWLDCIDGWEMRLSSDQLFEVRGKSLFKGYLSFENDRLEWQVRDPDAWHTTSDIVELADRRLKFIRRADRRVKILGELVDLDAIESQLRSATGAEVLIVPVAHERRGVSLVPVAEHPVALPHLRGVERLEKLLVIDTFPRNEMGKLKRVDIEAKIRQSVT